MRKWIGMLLLLSLLLTLAACNKQDEEPPESENPPQEETTPPAPDSTPEDKDPEPESDVTLFKGEGITFALPAEYDSQLVVDAAKDAWEPYLTLMSVYEKASLDAAEADFGDSAGYGFLFEIGAINVEDYEEFLALDLPASWVFAKDEDRYYIYTEPTDLQLYRQGVYSEENQFTDEDLKTWSALSALGPLVREDTIQRNGLTPCTAQELAQ